MLDFTFDRVDVLDFKTSPVLFIYIVPFSLWQTLIMNNPIQQLNSIKIYL